MKTNLYLSLILIFSFNLSFGQFFHYQYFDGSDTSVSNSLFIEIDSSSSNIWQIGSPQKTVFDQANTAPNAIITDSVNTYPVNNSSFFTFSTPLPVRSHPAGIFALQWSQKLDMDLNKDGGIVEFKFETDSVWKSIFDSPYAYNFYGFSQNNLDTLANGELAFTGTDSTWRDIWLCFSYSWISAADSGNLDFRFTFVSDSVDDGKDGWMVDNILMHPTWVHTLTETRQDNYLEVSPNPTSGKIYIQTERQKGFHIIEEMQLINSRGMVVDEFKNIPTKFNFDLSRHPAGIYTLKVRTNVATESLKVVLKK